MGSWRQPRESSRQQRINGSDERESARRPATGSNLSFKPLLLASSSRAPAAASAYKSERFTIRMLLRLAAYFSILLRISRMAFRKIGAATSHRSFEGPFA
jgi:hypothetical protein